MKNKESLQENQYHFPYHHLTHEKDGALYIFRHLFWGLEHYTYIKYVIDDVLRESFTSLIDIGCGEGRIISEIEKKLPTITLTGIDISERATFFAKGFTKSANFAVHDITKSEFCETFDAAVSCEVIEHIKPDQVDNYCRNIALSLNKNGLFFLTTPTTNVPVNAKHYQHFTYEILEKHLSPYFEIKKVEYLNCHSLYGRFLSSLLANRLYISNMKFLNKWILKEYNQKVLVGDKNTGSRIYIRCRKI